MISALEFFKAKDRMCKSGCTKCKLSKFNNGNRVVCGEVIINYPEVAVEIVENWAKENPVKTYKDVLLEKFPNCDLEELIKCNCPGHFFKTKYRNEKCNGIECENCWLQEYGEDNNA